MNESDKVIAVVALTRISDLALALAKEAMDGEGVLVEQTETDVIVRSLRNNKPTGYSLTVTRPRPKTS